MDGFKPYLAALVVWAFCTCNGVHAIGPENVLVLYHDDLSPSVTQGEAIRDHYLSVHGPTVKTFGLRFRSPPPEEITAEQYLSLIRQPLLDSGVLTDEIEVIVTTKGLPLRIDNKAPGSPPTRYSSLESELTRIDLIDSVEGMRDSDWISADFGYSNVGPANPYYKGPHALTGETRPLAGFKRDSNEGIRLATRLDGFTTEDVTAAIDRASGRIAAAPYQYSLVVDDDPYTAAYGLTRMEPLYEEVAQSHYLDAKLDNDTFDSQFVKYDVSRKAVLDAETPVIGYVSHGVHGGGLSSGHSGALDETGYIVEDLGFELADGAVFMTYESFNAYTFDIDSSARQTSHGQIAQWLAIGGTAGLGHVSEPLASTFTVANEDVFFDMMLSGYTFAEAAWASIRQLSYVNTVVGDPLMRYEPWMVGDFDLDGKVDIRDLSILATNFGTGGNTFSDGDLNGDSIIDIVDLDILSRLYSSENRATVVTRIPEPGALMLCIVGSLWIVNRAFRARRLTASPCSHY